MIANDRWFAKSQWICEVFDKGEPENPREYNLIDFNISNDSNLKVEEISLASLKFKARLKEELRMELKEELRMELKEELKMELKEELET